MIRSTEGNHDETYTKRLLQFATLYAEELRWKLVALHGYHNERCTCQDYRDREGLRDCPSPGKHPVLKQWDATASNDTAVILPRLESKPQSNLGVLLGPQSGIIDIEFDTDQGRETAEKLFAGIATPTYESARSRHYLFQWSARLPGVQKIEPKTGPLAGLEIRIGNGSKATQSVLPPSRHFSGAVYRWLDGLTPPLVDVAPLPREVLGAIRNYDAAADKIGSGQGLEAIKSETVSEGGRNDLLFKHACWLAGMVKNIASYGDQKLIQQMVECVNIAKCRPPLLEHEVDTIVNSAIFTERRGQAIADAGVKPEDAATAAANEAKPSSYAAMGIDYDDELKQYAPGNWHLEIVLADPVYYVLNIPAFCAYTTKKEAKIKIPGPMIDRPGDVARIIREATNGQAVVNPFPGQWELIWKGRKATKNDPGCEGLFSQLINAASTVDGSYFDKRWIVVAEELIDKLTNAYPAATGERGTEVITDRDFPTRFSNGDVYFRWQTIFIDGLNAKKFDEEDVKKLRERLGIDSAEKQKSVKVKGGVTTRMVVLSENDISHLQDTINHNPDDAEAPF